MKYAVEMGLGAMIYVRIFIKILSAIQKLIHRHADSEGISLSYIYFSK
jgi:hypothetical protein